MFADVVEGKKLESGTEKGEEGNMGNSVVEINGETVEQFEKGKEKIMEPDNHAMLKWEDFVAMLNKGANNMKIMRDMLEDFKGKLEILIQCYSLGCMEKGKDQMDLQQGNSGANVQLGQGVGVKENGPSLNKPNFCCSKTYYRKRYRVAALRRATRMLRREQKGSEMLPELSPEVRSLVATGSLIEGDRKHDLESTGKKSLAKEEGLAREIATASWEGKR
jgi:hypothetical protein